jgi:hypothetical protein
MRSPYCLCLCVSLLIFSFPVVSNWLQAGRQMGQSLSPGWVKNFLFSTSSTVPPIQWVPGALSPGVKWRGREADHSPPASAEEKKMWIYTPNPPYAFMA